VEFSREELLAVEADPEVQRGLAARTRAVLFGPQPEASGGVQTELGESS